MKRTQIQFEESQYQRLRRIAQLQHTSISAVVRSLVDEGLAARRGDSAPTGAAALLEISGVASGGPTDLGLRHDDYLAETAAP